ncbi:two-component system response regulator [Fulvitalea axinellae]|uniref:Two-component system response regulator n=1 Tax=Fulvitalea axinellae TaxID=1182444 RepID=A0AAU9CRB3_9BACT|nr:two-component system response regulator [Fulvitalea axinellae]
MQKHHILWADDEIDLLKPHVMFLEKKGYNVTPVTSATEALDLLDEQNFDVVFLDENMPGMTGLEALPLIKERRPDLPVVMITKSEEEMVMEDAIGSKISDYLIKPLNPNQILLSVKKILDNKRLVSEKTNLNYQQEFRNLGMAVADYQDFEGWKDIYSRLVYWELEIDNRTDNSMAEILEMQKSEANQAFSNYVEDNYEDWLNEPDIERPLMSHNVMKEKVFPHLEGDKPVFFILIDNLRLDQWQMLRPIITEGLDVEEEDTYYSILPTTTAYARNAIFSGMLPLEMSKRCPDIWVGEDVDEGKNNNEDKFLERQLKRARIDVKWSYHKIKQQSQGRALVDNVNNLMSNKLNVIVYNFVDLLSHARTEMEVIRELAHDESAYRSLTTSWFKNSPLGDLIKQLSSRDVKVVLTTDHGTIRVRKPYRIIGDRNTNTNLRYKQGKNLSFKDNDVFVARRPEKMHLPLVNVSTAYVFSTKDYFFAYPNNYNYYVNYYRDTFQHGGLSLEEMIIPIISLNSKHGK